MKDIERLPELVLEEFSLYRREKDLAYHPAVCENLHKRREEIKSDIPCNIKCVFFNTEDKNKEFKEIYAKVLNHYLNTQFLETQIVQCSNCEHFDFVDEETLDAVCLKGNKLDSERICKDYTQTVNIVVEPLEEYLDLVKKAKEFYKEKFSEELRTKTMRAV